MRNGEFLYDAYEQRRPLLRNRSDSEPELWKVKMSNITKVFTLALLISLAGCAARIQEPTQTAGVPEGASPDSWLSLSRFVGVEIESEGMTSSGGGVWLGNGKVLTAAHIRLGSKSDQIFVTSNGERVKADIVLSGMPPRNDLLLLKIDQALIPAALAKVPPAQVCGDVEPVGAKLYVTVRDRIYSTYASPAGTVMYKGKMWSNSTTALLSHGVSGSPVYEAKSDCLAGIVSRMELPAANPVDMKQTACEKATLRGEDAQQGITCAIEPKTFFMAADNIADFLKEAKERERINNGN